MARTINCDYPGCVAVADYMLTVIGAGETKGFCTAHYLVSCGAFMMAAGGEEITSDEADAIASLAPPPSQPVMEIPPGELWTCGGCGSEFSSEEMLAEHIAAEHATPPEGWKPDESVSRETIGAEA